MQIDLIKKGNGMLKILPIASGSTGNCMLVEIDGNRILIDFGISPKAVAAVLAANSYTWEEIRAVLITHTHADHVKGLETGRKKICAPFYMSATSKDKLMAEETIALPYFEKTEILPGMWVTAIPTSHDCPGSVGFRIETEQTVLGYLTDLGYVPERTMEMLSGADCIVLESNHDEELLRYCRYPIFLKKRILSNQGHLSNHDSAAALAWFADHGTKHFFLAHLSQENNRPELALECAMKATAGMDVHIEVLPVYGESTITVAG